MAHAPSALVRDAQLPLNLRGRNAMPRAGHEVHREKPFGQIGPRLMEDRASGRINVMAAPLADVGPAFGEGMEFRISPATGAGDFGPAVVHLHQLAEAGRVIRVNSLKLLESVGSWLHGDYPLPAIVGIP